MQFLPKYNYIFHKTRANNPKIYMEPKKILNSWNNLEKKVKQEVITLLDIIRLKSYNHQTSMVLAPKRHIDQWNSLKTPETNLCTYGPLSYSKETRIYNGEKAVFSPSSAWKIGQLYVKE